MKGSSKKLNRSKTKCEPLWIITWKSKIITAKINTAQSLIRRIDEIAVSEPPLPGFKAEFPSISLRKDHLRWTSSLSIRSPSQKRETIICSIWWERESAALMITVGSHRLPITAPLSIQLKMAAKSREGRIYSSTRASIMQSSIVWTN